jgi:deoxyribodipyrimidine photolyase
VRRYVPELRPVPDCWLHHPWDMPEEVAAACGVRVGVDYPWPIVDHREAQADLAFFPGGAPEPAPATSVARLSR